jgi:hypothetical protein
MGWSPASWIGGAAEGVVKGIATPGFDAWARTKESAAATHKIDKETERDMTVSSFQTDQRYGELQAVLANADRSDKRTAWIRPAGAAISMYVFACVAIEHSMPRLAKVLWIETSDLPMPWGYICGGILLAIFCIRPFEKKWAAGTVTQTHASIVQAQTAKPPILARIGTRRADSQ